MFLGLNWIKMMKAKDVIQKLLPLCIWSKPCVGLCGGLHTGAVVICGTFLSELKGGCLHSLWYSAWSLLRFGFVY